MRQIRLLILLVITVIVSQTDASHGHPKMIMDDYTNKLVEGKQMATEIAKLLATAEKLDIQGQRPLQKMIKSVFELLASVKNEVERAVPVSSTQTESVDSPASTSNEQLSGHRNDSSFKCFNENLLNVLKRYDVGAYGFQSFLTITVSSTVKPEQYCDDIGWLSRVAEEYSKAITVSPNPSHNSNISISVDRSSGDLASRLLRSLNEGGGYRSPNFDEVLAVGEYMYEKITELDRIKSAVLNNLNTGSYAPYLKERLTGYLKDLENSKKKLGKTLEMLTNGAESKQKHHGSHSGVHHHRHH